MLFTLLVNLIEIFKRCDVILSLDIFGKDSNKGGEVYISALLLSLSINMHYVSSRENYGPKK